MNRQDAKAAKIVNILGGLGVTQRVPGGLLA
jgi:hypothetical protein